MSAPIVHHETRAPLAPATVSHVDRFADGDGLARSRAWLNTHDSRARELPPVALITPRQPAPDAIGYTVAAGQLWERVGEGS